MINFFKIKEKFAQSSTQDIIWSFLSTIIKMGGALFILPLILIKFTSEELGLWYFFTSVCMFVLMIDVGFSTTIARNFRYVISSSKIYKYGVDNEKENSIDITLEEILFISKKIYLYISLVSIVILLTLSFYTYKLILESSLNLFENLFAWVIYSFSVCLNLRYYYRGAVLNGLNKIKLAQKIDIYSLIINYLITALLIFFDFGIISLALGTLLGLLVRIILYEIYIKINKVKMSKEKLYKSLKLLWPNTWKTGVCNLFGYLIKYLTTFFITIYIGLEVLGSYGITFQVIILITTISTIWVNTAYPTLNTFRIQEQNRDFYNLFYSRFKKGIITYIFLSVFFLFLGEFVLDLIGAKTQILPFKLTLFLIIHMFVDYLTNSYGYIIMTANRVPFIQSSLTQVVLIVLFNVIFNYLNMDIFGVLLAAFLAGAIYNYWYWIYNGYKEVKSLIIN